MGKKNKITKLTSGKVKLREIFIGDRKKEVRGILWLAGSILLLASIWPHSADNNALGIVGEFVFRSLFFLIGINIYFLPLIFFLYAYLIFKSVNVNNFYFKIIGSICLIIAIGVIVELLHPEAIEFAMVEKFYAWQGAQSFWQQVPESLRLWKNYAMPAGGILSAELTKFSITVFSVLGTYIIFITIIIISLYLLEVEEYFLGNFKKTLQKFRAFRKKIDDKITYAEPNNNPSLSSKKQASKNFSITQNNTEQPKIKVAPSPKVVESLATKDKRNNKNKVAQDNKILFEREDQILQDRKYSLPNLEILKSSLQNKVIANEYFTKMSRELEQALEQFGVAAKVVEVCPGPVVTRYELQPAPGVKINRILSLVDDIALAMKAEHVRIEAPIPGKGAVGLEIPNQERQLVSLRELLATSDFKEAKSKLTFALGKDIGGTHILSVLDTMPHLLIAGTTGSGKSSCINAILCSLLFRATPQQLKLILIDPKRVELTNYNGIPHLKSPVITDSREAAVALKFLVKEMEERYKLLASLGVRSIRDYNQKVSEKYGESKNVSENISIEEKDKLNFMPYIVVFIDELGELMLVAAQEVENAIARLAQMARGVGIHMVLATQRPSVDVITGVIKANFPSRIAFQVSSKVDSRTILDANGAENLLGKGDMLYAPASTNKPLRIQGVFVDTTEVDRVVAFWRNQGEPIFEQNFSKDNLSTETKKTTSNGAEDQLYEQARDWVLRAKQASTSMLQRRLKIGYSRAARLIDMLEEQGIVGPAEGSKPRKILVAEEVAEVG